MFERLDDFPRRHLGSNEADVAEMLAAVGAGSMEELVAETVPGAIRIAAPLAIDAHPSGRTPTESEALERLREHAQRNRVVRSFLGQGYHASRMPGVVQRNILENPGWYTQYTPYQAEIAQGRLEALLNYQTMVSELTALPIASASLLDEATAAAEAMHMCAPSTRIWRRWSVRSSSSPPIAIRRRSAS
jgi:glycine dehydrogenase